MRSFGLPRGIEPIALVLCLIAVAMSVATPRGGTSQQAGEPAPLSDLPWCDERGESAARTRVADASAAWGGESIQGADAMDGLVAALLRNGRGARPEARKLAQRAVRIKDSLLGADAPGLTIPLKQLAVVLMEAGDSRSAIPVLSRAIRIAERTSGANSLSLADTLDDLGSAFISTQRYDEAKRALERALAIRQAESPGEPEDLARTLERLAVLDHKEGRYSSARPLLERALRIRDAGRVRRPERAETLNLLGDQWWYEGNALEARRFYSEAVEIVSAACGDSHPRLPVYLRNVALASSDLGDLNAAVESDRRSLAIAESNLGSDHLEVARTLTDLAIRVTALGDYREARALYARASAIFSSLSNDRDSATVIQNLAVLNWRLGDLAEARRLGNQAITLLVRLLGAGHPNVARALHNFAFVLSLQARDAEARVFYERALDIRTRILKPGNTDLALTQMRFARTLFRLGDVRRAMDLSAHALNDRERADPTEDYNLTVLLTRRAELEFESGDFSNARAHYERGRAILERIAADSNPLVADALVGIAKSLAFEGDSDGALERAFRAEQIHRAVGKTTLGYLPERQSLEFLTRGEGGLGTGALDLALSLAAAARRHDGVLDVLVRSRSLVLDEMARRRHVVADAPPAQIAPLWAGLVSARQRYANLVVRGSDQTSRQFAALVADARREKEQAESALADKSAEFRTELTRAEVGLSDVRAAMPAGSALVAFARYERTIIDTTANLKVRTTQAPAGTTQARSRSRKPVPSYIAFVMRAGDEAVAVVPLGLAAGVDALVSKWRDEATGILRASTAAEAEKSYRLAGVALRQRVWDPLRAALGDAATVFVVPDGTLNLVSLAALPVGQSRFLIEQGPVIHYLSAERDLVANQSASTGTGLLAVGGAAFDDTSSFARANARVRLKPDTTGAHATATSAAALRTTCGSLQSLQFQPLEGTRREAREVAALWTDSPAQILENRAASERAFKTAAPGHRVLHLATHGFFLGSDCPPAATPATRSVGGLSAAPKAGAKLGLGESPLLLSGLALAGANRRAMAGPDEEDGILTAEEVTALNLEGVEWAVLSACDTGLGEVKAGEGVFGLRRAFQVAGVRTVIMSLWSVDDQAARIWMRALYERRLQKHLSTANAMHEASLSVLRARRARGQTTHPFYWAAFVATGAWQ